MDGAGTLHHARQVLLLVGLLTFGSATIAQFATQGVALFLRASDASSGLIGLIYVAAIPYTLRFLWAPLVDKFRLGSEGRYAGWLTWSQAITCLAVLALFVAPPDRAPAAILGLVSIFMIALGTQLTALGGLMAARLEPVFHPRASSVQGMSSAIAGVFLGAAVLYVLADLGWTFVVAALLSVSLASLAVALVLAPRVDAQVSPVAAAPSMLSHFSIFRKPKARRLFVITFLVNCAIVIPYAAKSILLIDAGFSIANSALYGLVGGSAVGVLAAFLSRPLVEAIGAIRALAGLGTTNVIVMICVVLAAGDAPGAGLTVVSVLFANASVFATFTVSRAAIMSLCAPGREATELTNFVGLETVLYLVIAGIGLALLDDVGFGTVTIAGVVLTSFGVVLTWPYGRETHDETAR